MRESEARSHSTDFPSLSGERDYLSARTDDSHRSMPQLIRVNEGLAVKPSTAIFRARFQGMGRVT